ncbi:MAG: hypothetical protein Q8O40_08140, partial [Chloroflexota bacterium]|nr:hypothetical protein [Chloroflexota bacterium]
MPNQTPEEKASPPIVVRVEQGQQEPTGGVMGTLIPLLNFVVVMLMVQFLPLLTKIGGVFGGPTKGFKDLVATYWSEAVGVGRLNEPGAKLDISDGMRFGAHVSFMHLDPAQTVKVGVWLDVAGYAVWTSLATVDVGNDASWKAYAVDVEGVFDRRGLPECRTITAVKLIQTTDGAEVLKDSDADCYHVVTSVTFTLPDDQSQYAADDGAWVISTTGSP